MRISHTNDGTAAYRPTVDTLITTAETLEFRTVGPVIRVRPVTVTGPGRWETYGIGRSLVHNVPVPGDIFNGRMVTA